MAVYGKRCCVLFGVSFFHHPLSFFRLSFHFIFYFLAVLILSILFFTADNLVCIFFLVLRVFCIDSNGIEV